MQPLFLAAKRRKRLAVGVSPRDERYSRCKPRSGDIRCVAAARLVLFQRSVPWAYAHGYVLPPLCGYFLPVLATKNVAAIDLQPAIRDRGFENCRSTEGVELFHDFDHLAAFDHCADGEPA